MRKLLAPTDPKVCILLWSTKCVKTPQRMETSPIQTMLSTKFFPETTIPLATTLELSKIRLIVDYLATLTTCGVISLRPIIPSAFNIERKKIYLSDINQDFLALSDQRLGYYLDRLGIEWLYCRRRLVPYKQRSKLIDWTKNHIEPRDISILPEPDQCITQIFILYQNTNYMASQLTLLYSQNILFLAWDISIFPESELNEVNQTSTSKTKMPAF